MKIQFIITGWHYNQDSLIDGLIELQAANPEIIDVYWACHRDPIDKIKDNFKWDLYPNLGMADGGYQQAVNYLDIKDDTMCFFLQDDIIIKNWGFIEICLAKLNQGFKFLGNCMNYMTNFNPYEKSKSEGLIIRDFVKESTKHLFDQSLQIKTIKGSFICCFYKDVKHIDFFEPIFHYPELIEPFYDEETKGWRTKNQKGLGGIGNVIQNLLNYKINRVFGPNSIDYLGTEFLDSPYIYECARGAIDPNRPPK